MFFPLTYVPDYSRSQARALSSPAVQVGLTRMLRWKPEEKTVFSSSPSYHACKPL